MFTSCKPFNWVPFPFFRVSGLPPECLFLMNKLLSNRATDAKQLVLGFMIGLYWIWFLSPTGSPTPATMLCSIDASSLRLNHEITDFTLLNQFNGFKFLAESWKKIWLVFHFPYLRSFHWFLHCSIISRFTQNPSLKWSDSCWYKSNCSLHSF